MNHESPQNTTVPRDAQFGPPLVRGCGLALVLGGAFLILINLIFTPRMPYQSSELYLSHIFLVRQSAAIADTLLLIFGALALNLTGKTAAGIFGAFTFVVSMVGGVGLFAIEWTNVFVLRAVAQANLETLAAIDKNSLMSIGFGVAAGLFALGWLCLAIRVWRARELPRWAAITTFVGLLSIPLLQASPLHLVGAILCNVIFGLGLIGLGWAVVRHGPRTA